MKKLVASLLTIALSLSFAAISLAGDYETFRFENYTYQVPSGWIYEEEIRTDEEYFTYLTRAHFAKEKETLSGGALVAVTDYPDDDKVDLENNEPVLEEWAAEMAEAEGMDLRRVEKLLIDNVHGLLFAGYLGDTPVSFTAWEDLGFLYSMVEGLDAQAIYCFKQVIKLDPEYPDPHFEIARIYALTGHNQDAIQQLQLACKKKFEDMNSISEDEDFKSIHELPEFNSLMEKCSTDEIK